MTGFKTRPLGADKNTVVIGWLTRIVVVLAVLGVLGYDGITLTAARLGATDDADSAATAAAASWRQAHDPSAAWIAAAGRLTTTEALVNGGFRIAADGSVVLEIRRTARTLVAQDLPGARSWTAFTASGSAPAAQ